MESAYGTSQLPLSGAILCCTAIPPEQRGKLAATATQMGAVIKLDLTSDVTHLIVGSTDSAKYRYVAKCREDVKVLAPEWIEALRNVWLLGEDDMDVAGLEEEYRLPTFSGLRICLTGFDNPEQRRYIQETVDKNGAEYHGDLTKVVTHLITANPSGKKYEHALNWRMKIVSLEWFEQSLERGMVLEESRYNPTLPAEERGKGAWDRNQIRSPAIGKRTRDAEQTPAMNPLKRKLRRSASTKFGTQSDALWAGITSAGFTPDKNEDDDWREDAPKQTTPQERMPAMRAKEGLTRQANVEPEAYAVPDPVENSLVHLDTASHAGIFQGRIVVTHAFDEEKTGILRQHLENNGAHVLHGDQLDHVSTDDLSRGFLVVPHDTQVKLASGSLPERAGSTMILVTNWWVERCLYGKSLVDPTNDVLSRPFNKLSISGFSGLIVNSTGYSGIELLHMTKAVTLMGAVYDEQLSAKTSVIVCNTYRPAPPKLKFASDRQIPAVHATWLEDSLSRGELQPYDAYMINKPALPQKPRQNQVLPSERHNAPRSGEESSKPHQKEAHEPNMITKRGPPQPRTLDMAMSADLNSTTATFTNQDNDASFPGTVRENPCVGGFDGHFSLSFQDRVTRPSCRPSTPPDSNARTGSRQRSSSAESLIRATSAGRNINTAKETTTGSIMPAPDNDGITLPPQPPEDAGEERDYSEILAKLRANRKTAPTLIDQADEKRRKRRQLGHATSIRSNQSSAGGSGNIDLNEVEDESSVLIQEYQPSQELGWDSPGAAKAREQMIKKLGGTVKERSVPAEGIGVVKDAVGESGLSRTSRRRRGGI